MKPDLRSCALPDLGDPGHDPAIRSSVDQVSLTVYPGAGAPDADRIAEREAPLRAVVEGGAQPPVVDDQRQALARERDPRSRDRTAVPRVDVHATVAVGDQGRKAAFERLVHRAADRRSVVAVPVNEAAVECGEQAP